MTDEDQGSFFDPQSGVGALGADDEPYDLPHDFDLAHEERDLHDFEEGDAPARVAAVSPMGPMGAARPRVVKTLSGAGKVYDWRSTNLLPPSGGTIRPLIMVEHIPVVPNRVGTGDFLQLAGILRAQGLSLQAATDQEGNVALYTPLDRMCFQARGANQVSIGVEHMHMSVSEDWSKKQLRASAWLWQYVEREYGIPLRVAQLGSGAGFVRVNKRGHTSHQRVSAAAGFNDRSDPGNKYDWEYVRRAAIFFKRKGHFRGV